MLCDGQGSVRQAILLVDRSFFFFIPHASDSKACSFLGCYNINWFAYNYINSIYSVLINNYLVNQLKHGFHQKHDLSRNKGMNADLNVSGKPAKT